MKFMGKILATTSGKGGVGKSTVATGLALAFSRLGNQVLLVDMDEGLRCLDLFLGVDDTAVLDLLDALDSEDVKDCAYVCGENIHLIPAPAKTGAVNREKLLAFARKCSSLYDIVIFDFPAGLDFSLYGALPKSTLFLTVAVSDPVSVRDSAKVSAELERLGLNSRLIINRFSLKTSLKRKFTGIDGIIDRSCLQLLGIIPESEDLNRLSVKHKIKPKGKAMKAFLRIAERLSQKEIPLPAPKKI